MDQLRDALNENVVRRFGDGLYLDYDKDQIEALQEDQERLWARISSATDLTVNEKRVMRGFDERPEGHVILVSSGDMPLEGIEERAEKPDPAVESGQPEDNEALSQRMKKLIGLMAQG
jgi:hypothetical protein